MLDFEKIYLVNSKISKEVIKNITNNNKIDFNKLQISDYEKEINEIIKLYNIFKSDKKENHRNSIFWKIINKKYKKIKIYQTLRKQNQKENKIDINIENLNENLGFKPSLLSLMIFDKEINEILKFGEFFHKLKKICHLVEFNFFERISLIKSLSKNNQINLISPICPDYDYVKIAHNLYKYTFNKLNTDIGLIGNSIINFKNELQSLFKENNFILNYYIYYGDFEAYSKSNCERLNINEKIFIDKLKLSVVKLKNKFPEAKEIDLLVSKLSTKYDWVKYHKKNYLKLNSMFSSNINFKNNILKILESRMGLYSNWFPNLKKKDYVNLILNQGAEYTTMGDLFHKKFNNFCILGMDHFKMAFFYCINNKIPLLYGKKIYE
jgi:hypothetical protein